MRDILATTSKRSLVLAMAGFAMLVAAPAPAPAAEIGPALKGVVEAARKEGTLKLFLHGGAFGDGLGIQRIQAGMNKMFGTNIEVRYSVGPTMGAIGNRILAEFKANRPASTDLYYGNASYAVPLIKDKALLSVDWTALLPDRITREMVDPDGLALPFISAQTRIAYNKNLIPNPPQTLAGFLAPEYKGKLASTPYAAGFDSLASVKEWGPEKTIEFAKALTGQLSGLIQCGDEHRIASGEFVAMVFSCGSETLRLVESGAPIGIYLPRDFVNVNYFHLMVPKHAEHPSAAKLFAVYMMTDEGQKLMWDLQRQDLHHFPGSNSAKLIEPSVNAATTEVVRTTVAWALANSETKGVAPEVIKIFRSSSSR